MNLKKEHNNFKNLYKKFLDNLEETKIIYNNFKNSLEVELETVIDEESLDFINETFKFSNKALENEVYKKLFLIDDIDKIEDFYKDAKSKKILIDIVSPFISDKMNAPIYEGLESGEIKINDCPNYPFDKNKVSNIELVANEILTLKQAKDMRSNNEILNSKIIKPFTAPNSKYYLYKLVDNELNELEKISIYKNLLDKESYKEIVNILNKALKDLDKIIDIIKFHQAKISNNESDIKEIEQEEINSFKQHISNIY